MNREKITEAEPKCVNCGKNEFKLTRTSNFQILADCIYCGEPQTLDAFDKDPSKFKSLQWFSPKMN